MARSVISGGPERVSHDPKHGEGLPMSRPAGFTASLIETDTYVVRNGDGLKLSEHAAAQVTDRLREIGEQ